jgi:uncharacterized protein
MRLSISLALLVLCSAICGCEKAAAPVAVVVAPPTAEEISAFMAAATAGDTVALRAALDKGMPVTQADPDSNHALIFAAYDGHVDAMKVLLDAGAVVDQPGIQGCTALMMACGPKPDGFPEAVQLLLDNGANVNAIDSNENFTPLMYASVEGLSSIASILVKAGADPTMTDIDGDTAASFARNSGFTVLGDRLQALIDAQ